MSLDKLSAHFHQFGNLLIVVAASSFVVLPAIEIVRTLLG